MTIDRSICPARRHGRYWTHAKYRCRCPDTLTELATRRAHYRAGTLPPGYIDATGTRRRLQALAVEGWSITQLAELTGISERGLHYAQRARHRVQLGTARAVAAVYDRVAGHDGSSRRTANRARAAGWVDSYAWPDAHIDNPAAGPQISDPSYVDTVAVDRVLAGQHDPRHLTHAELAAAARRGLERRMSVSSLAALLHTRTTRVHQLAAQAA